MTLYSLRIQPFILLSGSPPSEPLRSLNSATRFIILARETPERGKVSIEFAILPDGKVAGMKIIAPSGDVSLDRAAWGGITASNPFSPLPNEFHGPYLALRFHFYYNPAKGDIQ